MKNQIWADRRVCIIGLGSSGRACAEVLTTLGAKVSGIDAQEEVVSRCCQEYPRAQFYQGDQDSCEGILDKITPSLIVVSPGVSPRHSAFSWAAEHQVELWGEVELAWQIQKTATSRPDTPWLTITGTNGKTTTVGMTRSILEAAGYEALAVGNVGSPVVLAAANAKAQVLAVELSSFQLHTIRTLSPLAAVCLNIDADHLDWHGSQQAYAAAKARVYERTQKAAIYNQQAPQTLQMVLDADVTEGCRAIGFTTGTPDIFQLGIVEDMLVDRAYSANPHKEAIALAGRGDFHYYQAEPGITVLQDALAAAALARAFGVEAEAVRDGIRSFVPQAHRRVTVGRVAEVTWIDDSKATNTHAAAASLSGSSPNSVVWIAGGDAKGQSFDHLVQEVAKYLRGVILIGEDRSALRQALATYAPKVPVVEVVYHDDMMFSVVNEAVALSRPGDQVILAPACASWDQFASYSQRGEAFAKAVSRLEA
nr:UDP-N-acetylmuramoyl-L-alanine--D-glutamate ligase [Varibaculum vaginae]